MEAAWGPALASSTILVVVKGLKAFPHIFQDTLTKEKKKTCSKNCMTNNNPRRQDCSSHCQEILPKGVTAYSVLDGISSKLLTHLSLQILLYQILEQVEPS
jgi:hypothetical protein